jgi:hypothetical protein
MNAVKLGPNLTFDRVAPFGTMASGGSYVRFGRFTQTLQLGAATRIIGAGNLID